MTEKEQIGIALVAILRYPNGLPSREELVAQLSASGFSFNDTILDVAFAVKLEMDDPQPIPLLHTFVGFLLSSVVRVRVLVTTGVILCLIIGFILIPKFIVGNEIHKVSKELKDMKDKWSELNESYAVLSWSVVDDVPVWVQPKIDAMHNGEFSETLRTGKEKLEYANTYLDKWMPVQAKVLPDTVAAVKEDLLETVNLLKEVSREKENALQSLAEANELLTVSKQINKDLELLKGAPKRLKDSADEEKLNILKSLEADSDFSKSVTRIAGLAKTAELVKHFSRQLTELESSISNASIRPIPTVRETGNLARDAFNKGEYTRALELVAILQEKSKTLSETYKLFPVQVGGKYFIEAKVGPTHMFVKAVTWDGIPIRVKIKDTTTGTLMETDTWAEVITPEVTSIMQATLLEGGDISNIRFGEKEAGYLEPKYFFGPKASGTLDSEYGRLTTW